MEHPDKQTLLSYRFTSNSSRAEALWTNRPESWRRWFLIDELAALEPRKNRAAATLARWLAKRALRQLLCQAGYRRLALTEIQLLQTVHGEPQVALPAHCVTWLEQRNQGLHVSWSHADCQVMAVSLLAEQAAATEPMNRTEHNENSATI